MTVDGEPGGFTARDGVRIRFTHWGTRSGRPLFLQHGFASDSISEWFDSGIAQSIIATGRRVIAVDARGHGRSDAPHDPARYGEERLAGDLIELARHLGEPTIDILGYSMGAISALHVAASQPDLVQRLAIGGVGSGVVEVGGIDSRVVEPAALAAAFVGSDTTDPFLAAWRSQAVLGGADPVALAAAASAITQQGVQLTDIEAVTLIFAGADDPFAVRPESLQAAIHSSRLVTVPGDHTTARSAPLIANELANFFHP